MKKILRKAGILALLITIFAQLCGFFAFAAETPEDIDLNDRESILSWIEENIPEDLNELAEMPQDWWDGLLPNQEKVAEALAMPAYRSGEYAVTTYAYTPENGDQVAYMNLTSTGIKDGYGKVLWKITNGGSNVYCLDHGASCKKIYAYGNFTKMSGEVAYLIERYGNSSTISGYFCIQMAIWALQSASTEAEAWSYAYTWYLKSYDEVSAASWADATVTFYKLAKGQNGSVWVAEGPAGSQTTGKFEEFETVPFAGGEVPEPDGPEPEPVEPEFATIEDSAEVSYEVKILKTDWQTNVGLAGCKVDIFENGRKVGTVTTNAEGKASYKTSKSKTFTAEYCTNYDLLTPQQQAEISCFTSLEEAQEDINAQKANFKEIKYTYQCKEVTAPTGYVWQANEKTEKISGNESVTLKITNERTLGSVELIKYDTESESGITQGDATLEGAVYGIYAAENIVHQDKKTGVLYKKGELVTTAVIGKSPKRNTDGYILNTDASRHIEKPEGEIAYIDTPGKTLFGDLELGKYYIQEITPPEGYLPDKTKYEVTFSYKDQMVKVETRKETAGEADNTLTMDDGSDSKWVYSGDFVKKQGIQFVKTSDNGYQTEISPIEGAGFSIYLISDLSGVKNGTLTPVNGVWSSADIMTFYDYDFTDEPKAVLYKRKSEPWTKGDQKWLTSLGGNKYEVAEMFTDENGRIETPELPYGTYVVVETTTPENHVSAKPFIVEIREDSRSLQKQRIINNTITETFLRIVKADEEFLADPGTYIKAEEMIRGTVLKEGAQYRLKCLSFALSDESLKALNWKSDGEGYLSYYAPSEKVLLGTTEHPFTTTFLRFNGKIKDSYITLPQKLPIGSYELVEVTAPEGYVVNGSEQAVKDTSTGDVNSYEIVNVPKLKLVFTIDNASVYPDGQMGNNKYGLYDSYGNLTVTILQENQEQKGIVEIYKHGEQLAEVTEEKQFVYQEAPVEGAKFKIIAVEDIYTQELDSEILGQYGVNTEDYLLHKKGDIVGTITTDRNGWGYLSGLYIGKYKIVETMAGDGFVLNTNETEFEITPQEQTVSFDIYSADYKNERQKLEINVAKKDKETGTTLAGAMYGLYAAEDIYTNIVYNAEKEQWVICDTPEVLVTKDTLVATCITDDSGKGIFEKDLPLGAYYVKELEAPDGYLLSEKITAVDGSYESEKGGQNVEKQVHTVEYENKVSEVVISKQDLINSEELEGAALEVYEISEDEAGNEIVTLKESWISRFDEKGHLIKGLSLEKVYILRERKPAPGYVTAEEILFKLVQEKDAEGNLTEVTGVYSTDGEHWARVEKDILVMKDDVTKVEISKKDIADNEELPGATLEIYDESGDLVISWVSGDKPHYIEKLPVGKYTLVEKKAPAGYGYAEDIVFEIKDTGEIQKVEMFDNTQEVDVEKSTVSKTKPGEEYKYTIDTIKNCTDNTLEKFTMTDRLPGYVRLKTLSTGTYNQELEYSVEYQTNKNTQWSIWKAGLKTTSNYSLTLPEELKNGEYITSFRFCFGTVGGRFSKVISPEYTVRATADAAGVLNNKIELTAEVNGEPISDRDETDTPVEVPPKKEHPKGKEDENVKQPEIWIPIISGPDTGDGASVGVWSCMILVSIFAIPGVWKYKKSMESMENC